MSHPAASIVIPSRDEGDHLFDTVACIVEQTDEPDFEVIVVDDGSTDGSGDRVMEAFADSGRIRLVRGEGLGVAGARNHGAAVATGTVLVFLDAHSYTPPGWLPPLLAAFERPEVGLVGPTFGSLRHDPRVRGSGMTFVDAGLHTAWLHPRPGPPHPVPLTPGCCHALRRSDFEALGGYDDGMTRWGSEDLEICLRVWLLGSEVVIQPASTVYHLFREEHPYPVDIAAVLHNLLRMALLHFGPARFSRVVDHYKVWPGFAESMARLLAGDVLSRRRHWEEVRRRDDDWFVTNFGCAV
jgi:glycosyltransferase involved in cell wall biosynthesis